MFLTRLEINPRRVETMRLLSSAEVAHASIMAGFPAFGRDQGRVLWRIDNIGYSTYILIQSDLSPDLTHMVQQFGWPESDQRWDTVDYDGFLDSIESGELRKFRLTANPVRSVPSGKPGVRGKVCHHITAEQQMSWLIKQSSNSGFSVDPTKDDRCSATITSRKLDKFKRGDRTVTLSKVTFEGVLRVEDPQIIRDSIRNGIGRGKAYGCGMLSLSGKL